MRKSRMWALIAACGLIAVVASQWPDINRYLRMKRM
jgi:hypothetical protein